MPKMRETGNAGSAAWKGVLLALLTVSISACAYQQVPYLAYGPVRGIVLPAAPPDRAQVVFFLSAALPDVELAIYDGREQLGLLRYVTWFSSLLAPGDHRFAVVSSQSADFTVGRLEAGRTYFLEAQNIWDVRYRLQPLTPDTSRLGGKASGLMRGVYHVSPNSLAPAENERLRASRQATYETYEIKWETKPEADRRRILPEHAVTGPISIRLDEAGG
jgi:hypothetical protein